MSKSTQSILYQSLLILLGIVVFYQTLSYGFVPYDDPAYVTENYFVTQGISMESVRWAFLFDSDSSQLYHEGIENLWHPVTWLSHMLDVELFGYENARGHHFINVILHLISGVLVYWFCRVFFGNSFYVFIVAAIWLIHPLKAESVAWVSARKDTLSGVFFWGCLLSYLMCYKKGGYATFWKTISYGIFILGLLSKSSTIMLPLLLMAMEWYKSDNKNLDVMYIKNAVSRWSSWVLTSGLFAIITIYFQASGSHSFFIENNSFISRLIQVPTGFWYSLFKVFVPLGLTYEYPAFKDLLWLHALAWIVSVLLFRLLWQKRNSWRLAFFSAVWIFLCWLPTSGIVYVGSSFTTDRYFYLALAGVLFLGFYLKKSLVSQAVSLLIVVLLSVSCWRQAATWKDGWSLFKHATEVRPKLLSAWVNLGSMYKIDNKENKAVECYQQAIINNPHAYIAYYNLADIFYEKQNFEQAERNYLKAIELYPLFSKAYIHLAILYFEKAQYEKAANLVSGMKIKTPKALMIQLKSYLNLRDLESAKPILLQLESMKGIPVPMKGELEQMRKYIHR